MEQKEILELYETLRYGNKQNACSRIARQCNRQPNSVRNWFCSWKRIPVKFEAITIKILKNEYAATTPRD
jgi:hypothetical protein